MLSNSIGTKYRKEIALRGHQSSITLNRPFADSAKKKSATFTPGYLFSEYIWGGLVLVLSLTMALGRGIGKAVAWHRINRDLLKRTLDIIGSSVGLILTSPAFLILPVLIKLSSPGPVFYKQTRVGHNRRRGQRRKAAVSSLGRCNRDRRRQDIHGKPFQVFKFRTMVADAEKKCGAVWATKNDPRVTTLGRIMRKTRLDEIPQFLNVLRGEMSLVGPRPERPVFVEELSTQVADYRKRLDVKPGITGLAQIENGYDSSISSVVRKVQYDLQYIQNCSVWQDIKIMLRTVLVVVTGKGAM
jgi:lipopolysaccharide/colanic/teichoic acid biosynthesis glycosyltransferase